MHLHQPIVPSVGKTIGNVFCRQCPSEVRHRCLPFDCPSPSSVIHPRSACCPSPSLPSSIPIHISSPVNLQTPPSPLPCPCNRHPPPLQSPRVSIPFSHLISPPPLIPPFPYLPYLDSCSHSMHTTSAKGGRCHSRYCSTTHRPKQKSRCWRKHSSPTCWVSPTSICLWSSIPIRWTMTIYPCSCATLTRN